MINDRQIHITVGASRKALQWTPQALMLSELYERLRTPARGVETLEQYLKLRKDQQDGLKDVGGFVAGVLNGTRRKAAAVAGRDVLTLDIDNAAPGSTRALLCALDGLGCGYCVYSTRKHAPGTPRLRVLLPLDRTCTAEEYEPLARAMARYIDPSMRPFDPSTFEASRLMYWPSCCTGSEYIYTYADKPMLSVDGLLAVYTDWRDMSEWPQVPGSTEAVARQAAKRSAREQSDPATKKGLVGAFCRVYDIYRAMDVLLHGVYAPCDGMADRYTYTGGSTTGGAVVYEDGKYLYSHHATDPCSGKLVNAFDLVRLHLFGEADNEAKPDTPTNKLPSYGQMCAFANADAEVRAQLAQEQQQAILADFGQAALQTQEDANWRAKLKVGDTGAPAKTIDNIWLILENDPLLRGKFALNEFSGRGEVLAALPWCKRQQQRTWQDSDNDGVYWYMEKYYNITSTTKVDSALALHSDAHRFNEVETYLKSLQWDGVPRLDALFVDYLGAADTPYTRAVTRKAFTAAVARALSPGCKYDIMTVISGPQGIGKSTLLYKMARGWFNDSIRTFEGKEASELLQGTWIVEIGELNAFRKTDVDRIKQFLSLRVDKYRAAYGRHVKDFPRRCVFFGTTNSHEYLQDKTGNRRFWPVDAGVCPVKKSIWTNLDGEVDQLWAEARTRWESGEALYLTGTDEQEAKSLQEEHREHSPWEGIVREFLARKVPLNWNRWDRDKRLLFWSGSIQGGVMLMGRTRVCAQEVWCEALAGDLKRLRYSDSSEINSIIENTEGWKRLKKGARFGCYGVQRGFEKV